MHIATATALAPKMYPSPTTIMAGNLESSRAFCQLIRVNHKAIVLADGASSLTTKDSDSISGNHISLEGKEAMVLHALVRVGIRLAATNLRIKLLQFSWTGLRKSAVRLSVVFLIRPE
jgi:hypothetical protein